MGRMHQNFPRSPGEVFQASLKLGLTSFGGPVAHLGYFERLYVRERRWLSSQDFAGLVALCQLLPGPTSSQVGFLVGLRRAGWPGALAAWLGFTLPSALLMYGFGRLALEVHGSVAQAVLHGLMLTAVAVVAQAVMSMARTLCPDRERAAIGLVAAALLVHQNTAITQFLAMTGGAVAGAMLCRKLALSNWNAPAAVSRRAGFMALSAYAGMLFALPIASAFAPHSGVALAGIFYRAGAFVFGGGHVVLPLLHESMVPSGWVSDDTFLAGYGLAQGMPGPLFTLAAYLGAASAPVQMSPLWALLALFGIFLPGLLLAIAALSLWTRIADVRANAARAALAGINAAVVGVLGAALYRPVWTSSVHSGTDLLIVIAAFVLLMRWHIAPILVGAFCVIGSVAVALV